MSLKVSQGRYICPLCDHYFKSWDRGLKRHYQICKSFKSYITDDNNCKLCHRQFNQRSNVFAHLKKGHFSQDLESPSVEDSQTGKTSAKRQGSGIPLPPSK